PSRRISSSRPGRELDCDFLIGSVHFLDGWPFDHPDHVHGWDLRDVDEVYAAYYRMVAAAATSRLFDVIGHLDLVKIWGHRPRRRSELEHVRPLLGVLRQAGTAVEINTAGLRKPVGEIYPAQVLLEALFEASVPVTLASDAHRPDDVGADLGAAVVAARRAGYRRVMGFVGRRARERVL
ncbi:MAG: PHP domain-containing protein, partial [Syntrophomonadaceae bacterium]|nr:PHP domain-containing protein [Syntrophomonadaceae bacterium]